jgi:hypothetical protein
MVALFCLRFGSLGIMLDAGFGVPTDQTEIANDENELITLTSTE